MSDETAIADHVQGILTAIGEDPQREGLQRTPERVEKAFRFLTSGYAQDADALGLQLLLGLADPGDLGRRVDHPRHGVEVDMAVLAGDAFRDGDPFLLGLVREHGSVDAITNGIYGRYCRSEVRIHLNSTQSVCLNSQIFQS